MALQKTNDKITASFTRHTDSSITASVTGSAVQVGHIVERFGYEIGYGAERARLKVGGQALLKDGGEAVYVCSSCDESIYVSKETYYRS